MFTGGDDGDGDYKLRMICFGMFPPSPDRVWFILVSPS